MEKEDLHISKPEKWPDRRTVERSNDRIEVVYSQPASEIQLSHIEYRHKDGTPLTGLEVEDIYYQTSDWTLSLRSPEIGLSKDIKLIETEYLPDFAKYYPEFNQLIFTRLSAVVDETEKGSKVKMADFLSASNSMYVLLHEIGHSKNPELVSLNDKLKVLEQKQLEEADPEESQLYLSLIIGEERRAHAWALGKLRELRKRQIDIEPDIKTFKDFSEFIHSSLKVYIAKKKPA